MEFRAMGASLLGYGGMRFPVNRETRTIDEEKADALIHRAMEAGITYYDTAWPYHDGESEGFFGRVLSRYRRENYQLATKLPCWEIDSREKAAEVIATQLERLQTDYVDFYLLHSLTKKTWARMVELDILSLLEEYRRQGKLRRIGFSFHDSPELLDQLLTAHPVGEYYLWGQATLGFIVSVGWIVAKIFFGVDYAAADNVITGYTAVYYAISPKNQLNAMTTMMYPFLADFGYAGLVIGPAFYATMVMLAERHFKKHGNFSSLCMMVYFFHTLILSMQTYVFFKPDLLFTILFLLLFTTPISLKNGVLVIEKVPRARSLYDDELGGELLR